MLTRTLCAFKGLSAEAEARCWRRGCLNWRGLALQAPTLFSEGKSRLLLEQVLYFEAALQARCIDFFVGRLPCGHRLRILPEFREDVAWLDIETDGLGPRADITVIGMYWRGRMRSYVRGVNLEAFIGDWLQVGVLATFNGARFDVPMVMRHFGFSTHPPHIDLMAEARHWGFSGGLKCIEQQLGYVRNCDEQGDGGQAVTLWEAYRSSGNEDHLNKLLAYNRGDVMALETLARNFWKLSCRNYDAPHPLF